MGRPRIDGFREYVRLTHDSYEQIAVIAGGTSSIGLPVIPAGNKSAAIRTALAYLANAIETERAKQGPKVFSYGR